MSQLLPYQTSAGDICVAALREAGVLGIGQTATADEINDAWARLQWMIQMWQRERWLEWRNNTQLIASDGSLFYTVGPGGQFDTSSDFNDDFNADFGGPRSGSTGRPERIEAAFLRQITQSQPNQIDYPLEIVQSMEDYSRIALKTLVSFPGVVFYDPAWPLGKVYCWPVPQAGIYAIGLVVRQQLPGSFSDLSANMTFPMEYFEALVTNLAMHLRAKYSLGSFPGDTLPGRAKGALANIRGSNNAIQRLQMPASMARPGIYNIFSDRTY